MGSLDTPVIKTTGLVSQIIEKLNSFYLNCQVIDSNPAYNGYFDAMISVHWILGISVFCEHNRPENCVGLMCCTYYTYKIRTA